MATNERNDRTDRTNDPARNPDPITKAPGSHPIGTGVGAAVGGAAAAGGAVAAGAAMGSVVGPVGTAVGAAIGAVAGGLIGKGVVEGVNPTAEHEYWRQNYNQRPYVQSGASYDEYAPAYQAGWEARQAHAGEQFDDIEGQIVQDWNRARGKSKLTWEQAKAAARDSWDRVGDKRSQQE